jgi:hypothetical protein
MHFTAAWEWRMLMANHIPERQLVGSVTTTAAASIKDDRGALPPRALSHGIEEARVTA